MAPYNSFTSLPLNFQIFIIQAVTLCACIFPLEDHGTVLFLRFLYKAVGWNNFFLLGLIKPIGLEILVMISLMGTLTGPSFWADMFA